MKRALFRSSSLSVRLKRNLLQELVGRGFNALTVGNDVRCLLSRDVDLSHGDPFLKNQRQFFSGRPIQTQQEAQLKREPCPLRAATGLIQSTRKVIERLRSQDLNKTSNSRDDQSIDSLLKRWSQNSKRLESKVERVHRARPKVQQKPAKLSASSLLLESAEMVDQLARVLLEAPNPHQVYAVEVAITMWSRVKDDPSAAPRAQALFDMLHFSFGPAISVQTPLVRTRQRLYHALLLTWSRSSHSDSPANALQILQRMKQEGLENNISLVDTRSYDYTMAAMTNDIASRVVDSVLDLWNEMTEGGLKADALTYDTIIKAYQTSGKDVATAVKVFKEQLDLYRLDKAPHPNTRPLNLTLKRVLSMCQAKPQQVMQILEECIEFEKEHEECRGLVDIRTFLIAMQAFSRHAKNPEQTEKILMLLLSLDHIKPDKRVYGIVMDGYAKLGTVDSLRKVEATLTAMEQRLVLLNGKNFDVDCTVYNILMTAYLKTFPRDAVNSIEKTISRMKLSAQRFEKPELGPDPVSYTILMQAIIKEGKQGYPRRVEEILDLMKSDSQFRDKKLYSYAIAMAAWSNSNEPDAIDRIRSILDSVEKPDTTCYNTLLNAYAKHGRSDDALVLLQRMHHEYESGLNHTCRPDNVSYSTVIHALHKSNSTSWVRGAEVFRSMIDQYQHGDAKCKPSEKTVATLLQLLASSQVPTLHYVEAQKIWTTLESLRFEHGPFSATAFIEACSETKTDDTELLDEAFAFVGLVMSTLSNKSTPLVYNAALEACVKLIADEKKRLDYLRDLVKLCVTSGNMNAHVHNTIQRVCDATLYQELIDTGAIGADLPMSLEVLSNNA